MKCPGRAEQTAVLQCLSTDKTLTGAFIVPTCCSDEVRDRNRGRGRFLHHPFRKERRGCRAVKANKEAECWTQSTDRVLRLPKFLLRLVTSEAAKGWCMEIRN